MGDDLLVSQSSRWSVREFGDDPGGLGDCMRCSRSRWRSGPKKSASGWRWARWESSVVTTLVLRGMLRVMIAGIAIGLTRRLGERADGHNRCCLAEGIRSAGDCGGGRGADAGGVCGGDAAGVAGGADGSGYGAAAVDVTIEASIEAFTMKLLPETFSPATRNGLNAAVAEDPEVPSRAWSISRRPSSSGSAVRIAASRRLRLRGLDPGEIFVHRNVANLVAHVDPGTGSVGATRTRPKHLGVKVTLIICGHYGMR